MTGSDHSLAQLESELLAAHELGDNHRLVDLYKRAGQFREMGGDIDAACFYYTHAYVYALETGHADRDWLKARLVKFGREERA